MEDQENKPKENRISNLMGVSMMLVAGLFDLISLIPLVNVVLVPVGWLIYWFWFKTQGINIGFDSPKRLITMGGVSIIEIIPALSVLPAWILGIGLQLVLIRIEDKVGISVTSAGGLVDLGKGLASSGSKRKKLLRRAGQTPEKRHEVSERARNIGNIRKNREQESTKKLTDVTRPNRQNQPAYSEGS